MAQARPTLKSIAAELLLDPGSVSHILNHDDDRYSVATRNRVRAYAAKVGYRTNTLARAMRTNKTGIVGVLYRKESGHPLANEGFYMRLIEGLESELLESDYKILLSSVRDEEIIAGKIPDILSDGLVEGLIIIGVRQVKWLKAVKEINPKIVLLDQDLPGFHCVCPDNPSCGDLAATHFLKCGHRVMGIISDTNDDPSFARRVEGFIGTVNHHGGCGKVKIFRGDPWGDGGGDVAREIARMGLNGITALFGVNDHLAIGTLLEFVRQGKCIPGDLSIVGCDNLPEAAMVAPSLTTIQIPKRKMGQLAAQKLCQILREQNAVITPSTEYVECSLEIRNSVRIM